MGLIVMAFEQKGTGLLWQRSRVGVAGGYEFDKLLKHTTFLDSFFCSIWALEALQKMPKK